MSILIRRLVVLAMLWIIPLGLAETNQFGIWHVDDVGLPCFELTGSKSPSTQLKNDTSLPADPWCLLGNYRFKLLAHACGNYEIITAQRGWGRLNQAETPNSGLSASSVELLDASGKTTRSWTLSDCQSSNALTTRPTFGCGFASFAFDTEAFTGSRTFSVKPSTTPYNGFSAFLLTVKIKNKDTKPLSLSWKESVAAHYEMMQQQHLPIEKRLVQYSNTVAVLEERQFIKADIHALSVDPLLFTTRDSAARLEGFPPTLYVKFITNGLRADLSTRRQESANWLDSRVDLTLKPGEEKTLEWVIGYSYDASVQAIEKAVAGMLEKTSVPSSEKTNTISSGSAYATQWAKALPKFESETDPLLRRELIWHASVLESLASYSEYFNETRIPQGGDTCFDQGQDGSIRSLCENALPLCRYNPALAKSTLKYVMKHTLPSGEILAYQIGNGYCHNEGTFPSDLQLYYYQLLNEYVTTTQDADFLLELADAYPAKRMPRANSLDLLERTFRYLRDEIGVGPHGLMRLRNSDWNSTLYSTIPSIYPQTLALSESHKNTAMAIRVLGDLCNTLDQLQSNASFTSSLSQIKGLTQSIGLFRKGLVDALNKDLGNRTFSRSVYFDGKAIGETNLHLAPQVELLRFKDWSADRKKALYDELKKRLAVNEPIGFRQMETPEWNNAKGSAENGGIWYSLNGPLIMGVATWDKAEASQLLKKLTLENQSKAHPQNWFAYWSSAACLDSTLSSSEGQPPQNAQAFPVYSAAPHAWILQAHASITP